MNKSHAITARNEKLLSDVYVSYFANGDYPRHIARPINSNGKLIGADLKLKSMLENFPYNWSVIMCVFTIENGKPSIRKIETLNVEVTGIGWLSSPVGRDFDEDEVGRIFEKLSAF